MTRSIQAVAAPIRLIAEFAARRSNGGAIEAFLYLAGFDTDRLKSSTGS